jgi:hypothetical protein
VRRYATSELCESWRSSAAAVTRSRSESSPHHAPLPFFFQQSSVLILQGGPETG